MKKIVRLTESDLARIVKRVIREQEENDGEFGHNYGDNVVLIQNKSKEEVDRMLSNVYSSPVFIAIKNCEYFDIDEHEDLICGNNNLLVLNLTGTANNVKSSRCATRRLDEVAPGIWDGTKGIS